MDILHFAADKNGVFCIDPVDYPQRELMRVDKFLNNIDSLAIGELIFTAACNPDEFEMIKKHFLSRVTQ